MYRLATLHSVTGRRTDRQTDKGQHRANIPYCVQYDRLKLGQLVHVDDVNDSRQLETPVPGHWVMHAVHKGNS